MPSILRKLLLPALGSAAALALAVPAAHAETATAATPAIPPGVCANFLLQSVAKTSQWAVLNSKALLDFSTDGSATEFCQELIPTSNTIVEIFNPAGTGQCLAWDATAKDIYLHSSNGCTAGNVSYMEWRFVSEGGGVYEIQSQYADKECIYLTGPATLKPCNSASKADLFNYLPL